MPQESSTRFPENTILRLSRYLRALRGMEESGQNTVASQELAAATGVKPAQLRRDLAYFGDFGRPGLGYPIRELAGNLTQILGLTQSWKVALAGVGRLGMALMEYRGFDRQGYKISAAFEADHRKVGWEIEGVRVWDMADMPRVAREMDLRLGIIAVPAAAAQDVAQMMVQAGMRAILNFAPAQIAVPAEVKVRHVDLSVELECLSFYLTHGAQPGMAESGRD